ALDGSGLSTLPFLAWQARYFWTNSSTCWLRMPPTPTTSPGSPSSVPWFSFLLPRSCYWLSTFLRASKLLLGAHQERIKILGPLNCQWNVLTRPSPQTSNAPRGVSCYLIAAIRWPLTDYRLQITFL